MTENKKRVVVIFGGPSPEHDISIITGLQVIENIDPKKYEVMPIYWTRENTFITCNSFSSSKLIIKNIQREKIQVVWDINKKELMLKPGGLLSKGKSLKPDIIIPALHGSPGEDGNIQGLLQIFNVPFVGSPLGAAYLSMDKNMFKQVMKANDIQILPWQLLEKSNRSKFNVRFKYPVICKPNNLGSSIGVKRCANLQEVKEALELIFELDEKAIIEPFVEDLTEINCAVLGDWQNQQASVCERPVAKGEILDFNDKYLSGGKSKISKKTSGMASLDRVIPADVSEKISTSVQRVSLKVFEILGCSGVARIDCIYSKKTNRLVVNEINTIPGSFSFYLWEATGVSFRELIDKQIEIAVLNFERKGKITKTFQSSVLENFLNSS